MSDYTLPPVPDHPEPRHLRWSELERKAIAKYGHACAEAARAPLVARIAELEAARDSDYEFDAMRIDRDRLSAEVEALRATLDAAAKTRAPKPRTLAQRGTGALHGEQQHCFELGYREGAAAVRKAIASKIDAARKGEGSEG